MSRTKYGSKWQSSVQIQGVRISLGYFEFRSDCAKAEAVALRIQQALARHALITKKKGAELADQAAAT
jgi:hypothetical protein